MTPLLLLFALVIVNETVDLAVSDALLDNCKGHVEISGESKLVHFNGTVIAKNATLEIVDSEIDYLECYDSKIEAYHNRIGLAKLENCSLTASLNTLTAVIGNNSSYGNAMVTFTVLNKTMTDTVGNNWFPPSFANEVIDSDWDYVSDNIVCVKNIKIDGSHYCERILRGMHVSYTFHNVVKPATQPENRESSDRSENILPAFMLTGEKLLAPILGIGVGAPVILYLLRRWGS